MESCKHLYNEPIKQNNKIIKFLYNKLQKGEKILEKTRININTDDELEPLSGKWVPLNISEYISKHRGHTYKVNGNINSRNITIYFVCYDNTNEQTILYYTNYVFLLIHLLTNTKTICSKNLKIKIYLTPFKKVSSDNYSKVLGVNEVNTGFSNVGCREYSEITIYRKEEWFKVLIHELFHNLNLDFAVVDIQDIREKLYSLFKLDIKYDINETYAEIWARIILVVISSNINSNNYTEFYKSFIKLINDEIMFSIKQAGKILKHVNTMIKYKEDTNAYVYYVFTAALMYNYIYFLEWCNKNNETLFYFIKDKKNIESFMNLIIYSLENDNFKHNLICMYNVNLNKTMRMTSLNIF